MDLQIADATQSKPVRCLKYKQAHCKLGIKVIYLQWTLQWQHQNPHGWYVQSQTGRISQACPYPCPSSFLLQEQVNGSVCWWFSVMHGVFYCMYVCEYMCIVQIPHLFHKQTWRWSCFWASSLPVQMAVAFDWLTGGPWLLLLGCSSWQGGRGACPHTLRCHTSTHTSTCRVGMRWTNSNESKKYSQAVAC